MKKLLLSSLLLCLAILQAAAYEWTDDNGVTWTFSQQSFGYGGSNHSYWTITAAANYGDDVVVPGTVYNGETAYTVEAISGVFKGKNSLSTVSLPSTLKYIGSNTFYGCTALTSVGDISTVETIGDYAFYNCSQLIEVNLSSCQYIGFYAFYGCSSLQSIGSLAACKSIKVDAFYNCRQLRQVDLSDNVSLGESAFYGCSSLTSVGSLKDAKIGNSAFSGCSSLTAVDISQSASLGESAFYGCTNLQTVGDLSAYTAISSQVFYNCQKLENVNLSNCKSIGVYAFAYCSALTSVDLSKVTTIGSGAFWECSNLKTVGDVSAWTAIPDYLFSGCSKLQNLTLTNAKTIGNSAFNNCSSLTEVSLPAVTTIGSHAFYNCSSLAVVDISSTALTSIGDRAFDSHGIVTLTATTPAALGSSDAFGTMMLVRVPDAALSAYRSADVWSDFAARIIGISTKTDYDVEVSADATRSTLHETIGEENLNNVFSLKVTGDINSYDVMVLRNKMDNLHYLDLTDANIVANNYQYVTGYHTEDNVMPAYGFQNLSKLISVKLPKSITSIGDYAFQGCSNLKEVEFQEGLKSIGSHAFNECNNLKAINLKAGLETIGSYAFGDRISGNATQIEEVIIPYGVTTIGSYAFGYNNNLKRIALPNSLKTIGNNAFYSCYALESISLPTSLEEIPYRAFYGCSSLTEAKIPSTIKSIGNEAFSSCSKLNDVYTYIVEPTPISMKTFSTFTTATLHVPSTSYYNYWYDTEWSQFRNIEEFLGFYEYFYINKDFTVDDEQGIISADSGDEDPDADLNPGSGFIAETRPANPQMLDEVHIKAKGDDRASVITASNFVANKVYFDIEIEKGRWYFLSFPFDVKMANVTAPGNYVFRTYNPEERANGKTGWQDWIGDLLNKGQGYILHCSKAGTLTLCVEKEDMNWDAENRPQTLASSPADNQQDASWNFVGNPQTSYFDIDQTGYTQPMTVWNGSSYEAVRPGDDTYALKPFEAFFVQKPDNQSQIDFPAEGRYTNLQWQEESAKKAEARRLRGVSESRQIVNLTLSDGTRKDKTRVVFNEESRKTYEMATDAAKFMAADAAQLYTLDHEQSRYAINERPLGEVRLGYQAVKGGELTIGAVRMDQPVMLRDTKLQITHDLTTGDYTFTTAAGTFDDRFMLVIDGSATAIGQLRRQTGVSAMADEGAIYFAGIDGQEVGVYNLGGVLMAGHVGNGRVALPKGAYIVKVGSLTSKVIVR